MFCHPNNWRYFGGEFNSTGVFTMNAISTFMFHESYQLRMYILNGEPWFIAKDICNILEYKNSRKAISDNCRIKGVTTSYIPELSNRYVLIDEGNLYRLVIKSNMPLASKFEEWVCDEILPSIRKLGQYSTCEKPTSKTITVDQQAALHKLVSKRSENYPELKPIIWAKHNSHFNIPRYNELLEIHFDDAVQYIQNLKLPYIENKCKEQLKPVLMEIHPREKYWIDVIESIRPQALGYLFDLRSQVYRLGGEIRDWEFKDSEAIQVLLFHFLKNKQMTIEFKNSSNLSLIKDK